MVVGESKVTNMVLKMMGNATRDEIDNYITDVCSRDFIVMNSMEQVKNAFGEFLDIFLGSLTEEELLNLRSYTGYNFRNINAILRGNWTYDKNGGLTSERMEEFRKLADNISSVLNKFNMPKINFVTFRGTSIDSFFSYGITQLSQLESLKGKFLYEQGFTSTSILENTSYFDKDLGDGINYNIEIRYLISSECNDGALLIDNNMSYSSNQNEFLLDKGSLFKVIDVKIDDSANRAIMTVVLVPKKIYELEHGKSKNM